MEARRDHSILFVDLRGSWTICTGYLEQILAHLGELSTWVRKHSSGKADKPLDSSTVLP